MLYEMIGPGVRSTFTFGLLERFWPSTFFVSNKS